jgi:hypothetical protein
VAARGTGDLIVNSAVCPFVFFFNCCPALPQPPVPTVTGSYLVAVGVTASVIREAPAVSYDQILNPLICLVEVTGGT